MWPSLSDMSRDECRKCLRCLELDAYGNMVSVLRAQGPYTEEKRKLLGELGKILHISNERHRAEIRRAVNDEKLSVIAEQLNGPNSFTDWAIEGRRTIPLLPRLKAHTAFTGLANSLSLVIAAANEKKLAPVSRVEDSVVKSEPASPQDLEKSEKSKPSILTGDMKTRGRKRKRLSPVSLDSGKCRKAEEASPELSENRSVAKRTGSPMELDDKELSNVVQVSIVTPSSPAEATSRTENTTETLSTETDSNHRKFLAELLENKNCQEKSLPSKKLILEKENNRQDISKEINGQETIIAQSEIAKILGFEESQPGDDEFLKNATQPNKLTKISRPDSTTSGVPIPKKLVASKLCVSAKPKISSSTNALTINSAGTGAHGPGSPPLVPVKTLTCKKIAAEKLNNLSATKMGITLNPSKTLKINAHPTNARLSSKANVILVQKGSSRGVTLSHGGKEVLGKVIMGGKNLCLATNQKKNASVTLLPHRGESPSNGELTLTSLASNNGENIKLGAKTGNLIMLDIRQDVLDDSKVLKEYLESPEPLEAPETSIGLKNSEDSSSNHNSASENSVLTKNPDTPVVNGSSEKLEDFQEDCSNLYAIDGTLDPEELAEGSGILEAFQGVKMQVDQVLEAPTYDYESTEEIIIEDQVEESIETSGIDIFATSLDCPEINLENLEYVEDEEQEIIIETSDEILEEELCSEEAETIERLCDS